MGRLNYRKKQLVGGDFELSSIPNIPNNGLNKLTNGKPGTWSTNGRAALFLILRQLKLQGTNHIHLPSFMCQSILQPAKALEMDYSFYPVQTDLTALPDPPPNSAVLLIHYFGFINNSKGLLRHESGKDCHLIEDASHVFLNKWYFNKLEKQYVFFSTRKHGSTILGGWCNLEQDLDEPDKEIEILEWKSFAARLLKGNYLENKNGKSDSTTEDYYLELFREIEDSLNYGIYPTKLSQHILRLIDSINWDKIKRKRSENWKILHELIGNKVEHLFNHLPDGVVPLGYVIQLKNRDTIKAKLAAKQIFAPVHWPLPNEIERKMFPNSVKLADSLLTLPIDQRYGSDEMNYIADQLKLIM